MVEKNFTCDSEGLVGAQAFLESVCESPKPAIVMDEIVSNIVRCSGASGFTVGIDASEDGLRMVFSDEGKAFDPTTEVATPDITASAADRSIGGLGIFMVKKSMDDIKYKYEKEQNILDIYKRID